MNYFARTLAGVVARIRVSEDDALPTRKVHPGYELVAASATDQVLGATGAVGDVLDELVVVPATTAAGTITIKDGNGAAITVFVTGTLSNLTPFVIPIGLKCTAATTPGWKVTTGANVSVIAKGKFT